MVHTRQLWLRYAYTFVFSLCFSAPASLPNLDRSPTACPAHRQSTAGTPPSTRAAVETMATALQRAIHPAAATLPQLPVNASVLLLPTVAGAAVSAGYRLSYHTTRNLLSDATVTDPALTVTVTDATTPATTGAFTLITPNADTVRAVRIAVKCTP